MWICVTCSDENESWACIVEFPRGICLPSISSTEHFDQKKKMGKCNLHCCVWSFFHEVGDDRHKGQGWK